MAWFATYLGPRIGAEAALAAVTTYQDEMLPAITPAVSSDAIAFRSSILLMLLAGNNALSEMDACVSIRSHGIFLLSAVPDIAQATQTPVATWMSVMSQSSTNSAILIWCIAAAVYEKKHSAHLAG